MATKKTATKKVPVVNEESLLAVCADYAQASADVKKATDTLKTCKCAAKTEETDNNCLAFHWTLGYDSPEQEANFSKMCTSCQIAHTVIRGRVDAKKRLTLAQSNLLRVANRTGKAIISNKPEPTNYFPLAQMPISAIVN